MKANKNSIHARLYRLTYNSPLPENLCPYFWKLVWATIIFIPNIIIQLPAWIENLFEKDNNRNAGKNREYGIMLYFSLIILFIYTFCSYQWIKAIFNCYSYNYTFANSGWILNVIIFVIGLCWLIKRWIKLLSKGEQNEWGEEIEKEKKPSIIVEFIKAKYNKYCPKIDWE